MELPLCCTLNGRESDGHCCGFKLCDSCEEKYYRTSSVVYRNTLCNYIADLHLQFNPQCDRVLERFYKRKDYDK